jgi:hypothetical protein
MEISVEFTDLDRLVKALAASGKEGARVAAQALRHEAQEAFAKSQDLVPVDTGALKKSGRIIPETGVSTSGNEVYVTLSYGSTAADYAVYVHENLESAHPHGTAKYLEIPLTQQTYGAGARIADKVEASMGGMLK